MLRVGVNDRQASGGVGGDGEPGGQGGGCGVGGKPGGGVPGAGRWGGGSRDAGICESNALELGSVGVLTLIVHRGAGAGTRSRDNIEIVYLRYPTFCNVYATVL